MSGSMTRYLPVFGFSQSLACDFSRLIFFRRAIRRTRASWVRTSLAVFSVVVIRFAFLVLGFVVVYTIPFCLRSRALSTLLRWNRMRRPIRMNGMIPFSRQEHSVRRETGIVWSNSASDKMSLPGARSFVVGSLPSSAFCNMLLSMPAL